MVKNRSSKEQRRSDEFTNNVINVTIVINVVNVMNRSRKFVNKKKYLPKAFYFCRRTRPQPTTYIEKVDSGPDNDNHL